jgi:minor extracellular serine protease Vpr
MTLVLARRSVASAMIAVLILSALALAATAPIATVRAADTVDVIVQLEGTPAAITRSQGGDASAQVDRLRASQDAFLASLSAAGIRFTVLTTPYQQAGESATSLPLRYYWTLNGVALRVPAGTTNTIRSIEGVTNVTPVHEVRAFLDTSVPHTNAPSVWEDYGFFGQGITVADIDTGIAWDHGMFTTNPAAVPGVNHEKITKYYTFTEGLYDGNGHGTHVGGIIAGDSELGYAPNPLTGYGEALLDGVAPKATLFGYKVLSDAGTGLNASVVLAIDTAVADNADVLNLSLGSDDDSPDSPESVAVANAMAAGHFVAVAAGNAGPAYSTIGTPATREEILTVGSSTDPGNIQYYLEDRDGGERFAMNLMSNSPAPSNDPLIDERYVHVGEGCTSIDYAVKEPVIGKVALIKRGTCTFSVKKDLAEAHGAIAALIFNNVEGNFSGTMSGSEIVVGALSDADGAHLVAQTDARGLSSDAVLFDPNGDSRVGQISGFSSRGPTDDHRIKPDIVAPGDSITSSVTPIPNPLGVGEPSGYSDAGGTSMASPHMAGAAALMVEAHPDWTTQEIKAAFMNTAVQLADPVDGQPYSIMDQGAGMVDVRAAMDTPALIINPSHSFGEALTGGQTATFTAEFTIIDKSGDGGTWSLAWQDGDGRGRGGEGRTLPAAGWSQGLSPASVSVPAGGSATFTLSVTIDGAVLPEGDYEGRIAATGDGTTLRVPVFAHHDISPPSEGEVEQTVLYFHGNVGTHDSGEPDEANCTGSGTIDVTLETCGGPFLLESGELSPETAAFFGPSSFLLDCTVDRCPVDPNWVWNLTGPTTLSGPMTVEWWYGCPGCEALFFEDFFIRLWADGELVLEQQVRHTQLAPVLPVRLIDTITVPEVTANETFVLHIDPIFINQDESIIWYDSTQPCPGGTIAPCDSLVRMPVVAVVALPDLQVTALEASRQRPRATDPVTITATVSNVGPGDAAASTTEFVLDDTTALGTVETPAIPAGESATVSVEWDTRGLNGEHVIRATADSALAVAETDETNNAATLTVTVRGNRVENGSFEQASDDGIGPESWEGSDTAAGTAGWSGGGSHGERSVTFTGSGGNAALEGSPTWTSAPTTVKAGETLTVTAAVSAEGASSTASLSLTYLGAGGELLQTLTVLTAPLTTDGFETLEETVIVPTGVTEVRVVLTGFAATDLATSGTVTFDDVGLFTE